MSELSLEVGRSYTSMRGRVVDIVKKIPHKQYCFEDKSGWQYNAKGYSLRNYTGDMEFDGDGDNLVSESETTSYDGPLPGAVVTEPATITPGKLVVENPVITIPTYTEEVTLEITDRTTPLDILVRRGGNTITLTTLDPLEN